VEGTAKSLSESWSAWMLLPLHAGRVAKDSSAPYTAYLDYIGTCVDS